MRTKIVLDDELVAEAFALTGVRSKRELVHLALCELVKARKKNLVDLAGRVDFAKGYDHKALRTMRRVTPGKEARDNENEDALRALNELQRSLDLGREDVTRWKRTVRAERVASSKKGETRSS